MNPVDGNAGRANAVDDSLRDRNDCIETTKHAELDRLEQRALQRPCGEAVKSRDCGARRSPRGESAYHIRPISVRMNDVSIEIPNEMLERTQLRQISTRADHEWHDLSAAGRQCLDERMIGLFRIKNADDGVARPFQPSPTTAPRLRFRDHHIGPVP